MSALKPTLSATIEWITTQEGGRKAPPPGPTYTAPIRLDVDPTWQYGYWSLIANLVEAVDPFRWRAEVQFLMDDAPHHLLRPGGTFEFHEGRRVVGRGKLGDVVSNRPRI